MNRLNQVDESGSFLTWIFLEETGPISGRNEDPRGSYIATFESDAPDITAMARMLIANTPGVKVPLDNSQGNSNDQLGWTRVNLLADA
jgi:hypothetical protein